MWSEFIQREYLGNSVSAYILSLSILIGGYFLIKILKLVLFKYLKRWAEKTQTTLDDFFLQIIQKLFLPLLNFGIFYLAFISLNWPPFLRRLIDILGIGVITFFIARLIILLAVYGFELYSGKKRISLATQRSLRGILKVVKALVWSLAIVFFLDNIGFKISTVIAGLGIGGIAVGLAAQAILRDLFSYFSIVFDRPFEVGDFIIVDNYLGTVEYIGAKTTRIRSLSGEELIFSNTDLTDSRIQNYKRMEKRRVLFRIGVTYQTSLKQLKEIPGVIERIIRNVKDTVFDRAHFFSFGDFSLIIEVVYYVLGSDYNKYMDIQQEINFAIKEEFEKMGVEFAYPTQTLYLNKVELES